MKKEREREGLTHLGELGICFTTDTFKSTFLSLPLNPTLQPS